MKHALLLIPFIAVSGCGTYVGYKRSEASAEATPEPVRSGLEIPISAPRSRTATYEYVPEQPLIATATQRFSTFAVDVDTGSYSNVRRLISAGTLPPAGAVRAEEMINYFDYELPTPKNPEVLAVHAELTSSPWLEGSHLLRIALSAEPVRHDQRAAVNLVFLLDVSGSMRGNNRLGLMQRAMVSLLNLLGHRDTIAVVTYASDVHVALPPTAVVDAREMARSIETLTAGGSTYGEGGLRKAYELAARMHTPGATTRVLWATDGDLNQGMQTVEELLRFVREARRNGIALSTLGFGDNNYQEPILERLADQGDGNYAYIANMTDARRVVERSVASLVTVARDAKVQVEFNPKLISEYRLIGYANRQITRQQFADNGTDGGEIGPGHAVTAIYEITFHGSSAARLGFGRYGQRPEPSSIDEVAAVTVRYQTPESGADQQVGLIVRHSEASFASASDDMRFAVAVAGFAGWLRRDGWSPHARINDVIEIAAGAAGSDPERLDFVELARDARLLRHGTLAFQ